LLIIDSPAVKNTCNASVKSKGFCHDKSTNADGVVTPSAQQVAILSKRFESYVLDSTVVADGVVTPSGNCLLWQIWKQGWLFRKNLGVAE